MSNGGVTERVLRFGHATNLVGILSEPADGATVPRIEGAPVTLFLNSGIIHRVGASRLYVQMARRLAQQGFTSLRFDFSGIGDSDSRRDALRFEESALREIFEAMDHLEGIIGARTFVLSGLCSGADMAHEAGIVDDRVVGLVQLDPYAYRTRRWYLRYYGRRMVRLGVWTNAIRVRWKELGRRLKPVEDDGSPAVFVAPEYRRVVPPKERTEAGLRAMAQRGVRFLVFFTGDERDFLYPEQYAESFPSVPFGNRLTVLHLPHSNHTFTGLGSQVDVLGGVSRWYLSAYSREIRSATVPTDEPAQPDRVSA